MTDSNNYGHCAKCQSPVKIPGLDYFLCPKCGWVSCKKSLVRPAAPQPTVSQRRSAQKPKRKPIVVTTKRKTQQLKII